MAKVFLILLLSATTLANIREETRKLNENTNPPLKSSKFFYIQNVKSKLVLDTKDKNNRPRAEVVLVPMDGSTSQMWSYNGLAIEHYQSGLSLTVADRGKPMNNPLILDTWDTGNDKKWLFENNGRIRTAHWNYVLTDMGDGRVYATSKGLGHHQKFQKAYN